MPSSGLAPRSCLVASSSTRKRVLSRRAERVFRRSSTRAMCAPVSACCVFDSCSGRGGGGGGYKAEGWVAGQGRARLGLGGRGDGDGSKAQVKLRVSEGDGGGGANSGGCWRQWHLLVELWRDGDFVRLAARRRRRMVWRAGLYWAHETKDSGGEPASQRRYGTMGRL